MRSQRPQVVAQLPLRHPPAARLPSVDGDQPEALAVLREAHRRPRVQGHVVDRQDRTVPDQDPVPADGDGDVLDVRAHVDVQSHRVPDRQRAEEVRPAVTAEEELAPVGHRPGGWRLPDRDHSSVPDLHLRDAVGADDGRRPVGLPPQRGEHADAAGGHDRRVEVARRDGLPTGKGHRGLQEDLREGGQALLGEGGGQVATVGRGVPQRAVVDAHPERSAGGVDVEEVGVDPGDRSGRGHLLRERRAVGHRAGVEVGGTQPGPAQVGGEHVALHPAVRVETGELGQLESRGDGGRAAADRETEVRRAPARGRPQVGFDPRGRRGTVLGECRPGGGPRIGGGGGGR